MSSPILVIGALGNVGAEVVRELLNSSCYLGMEADKIHEIR